MNIRKHISNLVKQLDFVKGNFGIIIASWVLMDFTREMVMTYSNLYIKALGGSATIIGVIGFVSQTLRAIVQIPGGDLADRIGRKKLIIVMTFLTGGAYLIYALAPSWHWIMVASITVSVFSVYYPASTAISMDSIPNDRRGLGFSIMNLVEGVSTTPSPLIAGYLLARMGLVPAVRLMYGMMAVTMFLVGFMRFRLTETINTTESVNVNELLKKIPDSLKSCLAALKDVSMDVTYLIIADFFIFIGLGLTMPIQILYAIDVLGIPEYEWSVILTFFGVTMVLLALPVGWVIDKIDRKHAFIFAVLLFSASTPLFIYGTVTRLRIYQILTGLGVIAIMSSSQAWLADLVPMEHRGKISGLTGFVQTGGIALGQLMGGYLYDYVSKTIPFWIEIILVIPMMYFLLKTRESIPNAPPIEVVS